jgi:hypothetical protein
MSKKIILLYLLVLSCCSLSYGQERGDSLQQVGFRKNSVHATAGFAGLMGAYNVTYERMILESKGDGFQGLWVKVGTGGWGVWSSGGPYQSLMLGILTGARSSHFELNFGIVRMVNKSTYERDKYTSDFYSEPAPSKSSYTHIRPAGSVGYRYQKPGGRFLFRTGIGYPETLYLGLGTAF